MTDVAPAFDPQPCLEGPRLALRPLRADDKAALYAAAADPLIWAQHPVPDRHTEPEFDRFFAESLASGGALVVIERASGRIIGTSRFHGYDAARREVEIGWTFLGRAYWGGSYNRELKRLMLDHAFRCVDRVLFCIGPDNLRSQRAVEKIGARRDAEPDTHGRVVYRITRQAFEANATNPI